jgi:MFS family permease
MYPTIRDPLTSPPGSGTGRRWSGVSRNVLLLGLTSLFTDVSSEMMTAVLPLYFVLELKMTPLQFGVIDGLYQGVGALVRVGSGFVSDAGQRHKQVAVIGYGLSAACRAGLLVVGPAWSNLVAVLMLDRIGKGIRTAPRDALITLSSNRERLGEAFGAHRALDTIGAMLGPVVAFGILGLVPGAYNATFVVSLAFAIIGVAIITLFVQNQVAHTVIADRRSTWDRVRTVAGHRPLRRLLTAGAVLGALTATDALIYLLVQRQGAVPSSVFPLLFFGTASAYLLLAWPVGRLADRIGRHRLFLSGHLPIVLIYGLLVGRPTLSGTDVVVVVFLLGVYYAATDGVLAALAGGVLPREHTSTGQALVSTTWAVARLSAAAAFGAVWTYAGPSAALWAFLLGMVVAIGLAAAALGRAHHWERAGEAT